METGRFAGFFVVAGGLAGASATTGVLEVAGRAVTVRCLTETKPESVLDAEAVLLPPRETAAAVCVLPTTFTLTLTGTDPVPVPNLPGDVITGTLVSNFTGVPSESVSGPRASRPATLTPARAPAGIHARFIALSPSSTLHLPGTDPSLGLLPMSAREPRTLRVGAPPEWESAWPSSSGSRSSS